jgi:hypothetical protein
MDEKVWQQVNMLKILHATCKTALDAFYAADNLIDRELILDLEKMVARTRLELDAFRQSLVGQCWGDDPSLT